MAMLFRLSSKAFSRAVNSKNSHGFRYFLGMETALANDWCITVQLNKNTEEKQKKGILDWDLNPLPIIG